MTPGGQLPGQPDHQRLTGRQQAQRPAQLQELVAGRLPGEHQHHGEAGQGRQQVGLPHVSVAGQQRHDAQPEGVDGHARVRVRARAIARTLPAQPGQDHPGQPQGQAHVGLWQDQPEQHQAQPDAGEDEDLGGVGAAPQPEEGPGGQQAQARAGQGSQVHLQRQQADDEARGRASALEAGQGRVPPQAEQGKQRQQPAKPEGRAAQMRPPQATGESAPGQAEAGKERPVEPDAGRRGGGEQALQQKCRAGCGGGGQQYQRGDPGPGLAAVDSRGAKKEQRRLTTGQGAPPQPCVPVGLLGVGGRRDQRHHLHQVGDDHQRP